MKTYIFIETGYEDTPEYVFVDMLCKKCIGQGKYSIVRIDGYDNFNPEANKPESVRQFMEDAFDECLNDECSKFIILFDADKDFAGRKRSIDTWVKEHQQIIKKELKKKHQQIIKKEFEYDIFLFPDNQSNGNFEDLLKGIVNAKHRKIFCCLDAMQNCLEKEGYCNYHPDPKERMYIYAMCVTGEKKKIKKGDYSFENKEYWNLDHPDLQELKKF